MKRYIFSRLAFPALAVFLGIAFTASASVPPMEVTVFDASGKVAFKGPTSANATFATGNLQPGSYVVQLKTRSEAAKDYQFLFVVSAGKKKVIASGVPGKTFISGGAAMKVSVGPGLKITGKVAKEEAGEGVSKYRVIDGKRYFWVIAETGSNRGGHWVEEGLAPAGNLVATTSDDIRRRQDHAGEGSMIHYSQYQPPVRRGY